MIHILITLVLYLHHSLTTPSQPSPPAVVSQQSIPSSPTQLNLPILLPDTTQNTLFSQPPISHSLIQPTHSSQPKPNLSTHKMITRAKAGIYKPKAYLTDHNSLEPSTVSEALSDPKWKAAMQTEYPYAYVPILQTSWVQMGVQNQVQHRWLSFKT